MAETESLIFFQPSIGISAGIKPEKGRAKRISRNSHCRALMNTGISTAIRPMFTSKETITKPRVNDPWGYGYTERITRYTAKNSLARNGLEASATFSIEKLGLRKRCRKQRRDRYGGCYTADFPEKKPVSQKRMKDFFYLADLLLGTFGVLFSPAEKDSPWKRSPVPRVVPNRLEYRGLNSLPLLHPALTALFFGQLRLAAFLARNELAEDIRQVVPERELRQALKDGDRKTCVRFLKRARPWILRSENGLWAFTLRGGERFDRLLRYLSADGNAYKLFGNSIAQNWQLLRDSPYGADFHNHGFQDFMSQGKGDNKVMSALREMRQKKAA